MNLLALLLLLLLLGGGGVASGLNLVVVVLVVLLLFGGLGTYPAWPHMEPYARYGYYPSGFFGLLLIVFLVMALSGRLR